jgi:predicted RNA-binding protein YlxR (DUF448 family)
MLATLDRARMAEPNAETVELDAGPRKTAPGSERFCAATGVVRPVSEMIRFVVAPDGTAVADIKRALPGRGIWITASRDALATAIARKVFRRGFKREVKIAPDLVAATERLLEQAALAALAIAHKAGLVAIGFAKAESAIERGQAVALLHAADAAPDGARKLDAAGRRAGGPAPVIDLFTSAQLDLALGRANVVHAALLSGREGETFRARTARLERFRSGNAEIGASQDRSRPE